MAQRMADVAAPDAPVPQRFSRVVHDVTLAAYLVVVLLITLWPTPPDPATFGWLEQALTWAHAHGLPDAVGLPFVEAAANVVLFVPLGWLLVRTRSVRPALTVAAGCALSAAIELTQLALPGRYPTLQDVAMNTIGAALGAGAVVLARRMARHAPDGDGPHPADPSRGPTP